MVTHAAAAEARTVVLFESKHAEPDRLASPVVAAGDERSG